MFENLSARLQKKEISPVELLQEYLTRIKSKDSQLNCFIEVEEKEAMAQAKKSEERIVKGASLSKWDGIPIGIKDNIVTRGRKTTCASKILQGFESPYSATVIQKLENAGMVTLGRLNMDEFAMGSSTENSSVKTTRNPYDLDRAPGGSSGGSASAVSADFIPAALGSDTGGSIRQPAAFCGIVGHKPTYGTISRFGLIAFASSLDQIGPMTQSVHDSEILYHLMAGHDANDSTSVSLAPMEKFSNYNSQKIEKIKIGVPADLIDACDTDVKKSFEESLNIIQSQIPGTELIDISLPHQKYGIPVYYLTATSEASTNLSRFDGIRYGYRFEDAKNLADVYEMSRTLGFGPEVKRRILLGTYALSSGYYDAFYGQAQKVRSLIRQDYLQAWDKVDIIMMPSAPSVAFKLGEKTKDPVSMYLSDVLTVGASLAGVPALSVPMPFDELPVGLQIQGPYFSEPMLFALGKVLESQLNNKKPNI